MALVTGALNKTLVLVSRVPNHALSIQGLPEDEYSPLPTFRLPVS